VTAASRRSCSSQRRRHEIDFGKFKIFSFHWKLKKLLWLPNSEEKIFSLSIVLLCLRQQSLRIRRQHSMRTDVSIIPLFGRDFAGEWQIFGGYGTSSHVADIITFHPTSSTYPQTAIFVRRGCGMHRSGTKSFVVSA